MCIRDRSKVQLGLETTRKPGITLGNYQESKVRWLHKLMGEWVERGVAASQEQAVEIGSGS